MNTNTISKNLIHHRILKGYTQDSLSEKTRIRVQTIQRIENGVLQPNLKTMKLLASALEMKVEDLWQTEDNQRKIPDKKWLLLLHFMPILGLILPFLNVVLTFILWAYKREDHKLYDVHGRAVLNFQLSMSILLVISLIALLTVESVGYLFFVAVIFFMVIVTIINIISVFNSKNIFYPLSFPFLKEKKKSVL